MCSDSLCFKGFAEGVASKHAAFYSSISQQSPGFKSAADVPPSSADEIACP